MLINQSAVKPVHGAYEPLSAHFFLVSFRVKGEKNCQSLDSSPFFKGGVREILCLSKSSLTLR